VETMAAQTDPAVGQTDGETQLGGEIWRWHQLVAVTSDRDIKRIDVAVNRDPGQPPVATVSAFKGLR
jgi:hypothetical protein